MNEIIFPVQSTKTLIKAAIVATLIAIVVFVTVVLPSEFNRDPTGIGTKLGLTVLAQDASITILPQALAQPLALAPEDSIYAFMEDETTIEVPANKGIEYI